MRTTLPSELSEVQLLARWTAIAFMVLVTGLSTTTADEPQADGANHEYFERKIRPLLSERCYACHSSEAKTTQGGLRLDSAAALEQGGDSGRVIVPGQPDESLLIEAIRYDGDIQMPPEGKLPDAEINELVAWIERGAPFPPTADQPQEAHSGIDFEAGRTFWSFQPAAEQPLPQVNLTEWPQTRIDYFLLAAMEQRGLSPSPPADRGTLIRRLSFDLIGLAPSPEEVQAFIDDVSPDAYETLLERLLASPHYGEKWARLWLDVARYTDRTANYLNLTGDAHLYRDWVVHAFNEDLPYDQFVHRQLATDLMPETGLEDLPALGFLSLSPTYWKELKLPCEVIKVIVADEWEERVDAVSRSFLGLTVACARCHDHKFDPISSEDYYALAGVFASCRPVALPMIPDEEYEPVRRAKQEVESLEGELAKLSEEKPPPEDQIAALKARIEEVKTSTHLYDVPLANALIEESLSVVRAGEKPEDGTKLEYSPGPQDLPLFVRGNPNRPGPIVRRRFLAVLDNDPQPFVNGSGRLELAQAITNEGASLAARVIVNRIWAAHFGEGIVSTPSDFGRQGSPPTHPELLDDLAARFIAGGWSIKDLHREILLSATWQQSSQIANKATVDPGNRWLSHMNRRRLDFEEWRDAMLLAGGDLDLSIGGESQDVDDSANHRRTLYGTVHRHEMSTTLQIHDFPDPNQHSPQRLPTTTALQSLYALNSPLMAQRSQVLVERLFREVPNDEHGRITRAYQLLYSRAPTEREHELAIQYLGDVSGEERTARWRQYLHALFASNEFLFVD